MGDHGDDHLRKLLWIGCFGFITYIWNGLKVNWMKRFALLLLVVAVFSMQVVHGEMRAMHIVDDIKLSGNETQIIDEDSNIIGGLVLNDNSSLTIIDSLILFGEREDAEYTLSGNSKLTAINCTIRWISSNSLQASQNASIELINVEIYEPYEVNSRNYFSTGIGLAGNSEVNIRDSSIGFIRLAENAQCRVTNSHIGNFGTLSTGESELNNCKVETLSLYYEKNWVQINQTMTGKHEMFNQSQFVKSGETPYDFMMINSTLISPPSIIIVDGNWRQETPQ